MSSISCVRLDAKASIEPSVVGTIAMFDVTAPSIAFSVEATGGGLPLSGHKVRYPSGPGGTTVALKMYAWAIFEGPHTLSATSTVSSSTNGCPLPTWRVSSTRHGATG